MILGPNGAGKSTFLKLCSQEVQPTAGQITLHDRNLKAWPCDELALFRGVLSQNQFLSFPMDVPELVMMGRYPHLQKRSIQPGDKRIIQESMAECSAQHLQGRSTHFLSGGELQRVHTARVLAQIWEEHPEHPRLLLLDEPTASLDPAYQHLCLQNARKLADQGVCVVAILHDLNLAARYADRIVFLKDGRLVAAGPKEDMMQESWLQEVFGVEIYTVRDPRLSHPLIVTMGPQAESSTKEPQLRSI